MKMIAQVFRGGLTRRCAAKKLYQTCNVRCKSVLVTGGAQGIGEGICRRLAADGYDVTVADVQIESGRKVATDVNGNFLKVDVTNPKEVASAVKKVVKNHGTLDALVNNAGGIIHLPSNIGNCDIDEWKQTVDLNLNGVFYGLKYGLSQMSKQESGGSIVNLASIAGLQASPYASDYCASKFAVVGLTQTAALEYANKNIRVNAIAPTWVETPLTMNYVDIFPENQKQAIIDSLTWTNALPGFTQPSDIAAACAFLLSNENAKYITGITLPVDGGATCRLASTPIDEIEKKMNTLIEVALDQANHKEK